MQAAKAKRVRLEDIAKVAEISVSAASMALADHPGISAETKRRVLSLSRKLGYRKLEARPNSRRTRKLGLMLVGDRFESEDNTAILSNMMSIGVVRGFRVEVAAIDETEDRKVVLERILEFCSGLDGVILSGLLQPSDVARVHQLEMPCVMLGQVTPDPLTAGDPSRRFGHIVGGDDIAMGRYAAAWLASQGHRRIAFVCEVLPKGLFHDRWLAGYRLGLIDAGITPDPALVHVCGVRRGGAAPAAEAILKMHHRPTAFVVPDVRIGASFIETMRARGVDIGPRAIVLAGTPTNARHFHVGHLPLITASIKGTAEICVHHLLHFRSHPSAAFVQIYVPTEIHNMD